MQKSRLLLLLVVEHSQYSSHFSTYTFCYIVVLFLKDILVLLQFLCNKLGCLYKKKKKKLSAFCVLSLHLYLLCFAMSYASKWTIAVMRTLLLLKIFCNIDASISSWVINIFFPDSSKVGIHINLCYSVLSVILLSNMSYI